MKCLIGQNSFLYLFVIKGFLILSYCILVAVQQEIGTTRRPHLQSLGNVRQGQVSPIDILFLSARKLAKYVQPPMRSSLAVHFKLIVVPRRKRAAQNTLPASPLRCKPKPDLVFHAKAK